MNCNNTIKALIFGSIMIFCLNPHLYAAQSKITVSGKVTDSQTGSPLPGANIIVKPGSTGTTSDEKGLYSIKLDPGDYTIEATFIGYDAFVQKIQIKSLALKNINFILNPRVLPGEELTVTAQGLDPEITRYEIRARELQRMSAPVPDALVMIKALPGVSSVNDQSSFFNIRGGNFDENLLYINGIEIYQPHIVRKGIMENPSLVNAELVQQINLRTGAFPVYFGDKLSSALDISYVNKINKTHGTIDISTTGISTALQTAVSKKLSLLVGLRKFNYSYLLDHLKNTETEYHPDYRDAQAILYYSPTQNLKFALMGMYADSKYESFPQEWVYFYRGVGHTKVGFKGNEDLNYNTTLWAITTEYKKNKYTVSLRNSLYKQKEDETTNLNGAMFFGSDIENKPGENNYEQKNMFTHIVNSSYNGTIYSGILSVDYFPVSSLTFKTGIEYKDFRNNSDLYEYQILETDAGDSLFQPDLNYDRNVNSHGSLLAGYIHAAYQATPKLLLQPGLRIVTSSLNNETLALPRISVFYDVNKSTQIQLAAGKYAQPPMYKEFEFRTDSYSGLLAQKSTMLTLGIQKEYPSHRGYKVELYYKDLQDIISYDVRDVRCRYSGYNDAKGYTFGLDAYVHFQYPGETESWLSYSYLVAREKLNNSNKGYVPRPTDRRHQFTMYMEDEMQKWKNSRMHVRMVWGTPYPHTWQLWVLNSETGEYEYKKGSRNSGRLTKYERFDIGFTQEFKIHSAKLVLREEVLNVFNKYNVLAYDFIFNSRVDYYMSGRVYNLGFRVEL